MVVILETVPICILMVFMKGSLLLENYIIFRPFACLPVFNYPTVVCRFSPVQYQIKENENNGQMAILNLPYHFGYIMNI